ncbi:hypothetical protein PFISCL1PPCAC_20885, partial [Pristionchus fissidentatus]
NAVIRPLFVSPFAHPFECLLLLDFRVVLLNFKQDKKKKRKKYEMQLRKFEITGAVTAAHSIPDMNIAVIAAQSILYVIATVICNTAPGSSLPPLAVEQMPDEEPIRRISVSDRQTKAERTMTTMAVTCIRLWGLTKKGVVTSRGSIDFTDSPLSACALTYRNVTFEKLREDSPKSDEEVVEDETTKSLRRNMQLMRAVLLSTLEEHACTTRDKNGRLRRCEMGDCTWVHSLHEHLAACLTPTECDDADCSLLRFWLECNTQEKMADERLAEAYTKFVRSDVERMERLSQSMTRCLARETVKRNAQAEERKKKGSQVDMKSYELLVIAFESGEVKFVDAASYRTPSMQLLPTDASNADIVKFCPIYTEMKRGGTGVGRKSIDNLLGILVLTNE